MNCLTLTEPFATLIACGEKRIETRSWCAPQNAIEQPIAIHAAKGFTREDAEYALGHPHIKAALVRHGYGTLSSLPFGCVVATAVLAACERTEVARKGRYVTPAELAFGDFSDGRYAWHLRDVRRLDEPIPARGKLGLWDWDESQLAITAGQGS